VTAPNGRDLAYIMAAPDLPAALARASITGQTSAGDRGAHLAAAATCWADRWAEVWQVVARDVWISEAFRDRARERLRAELGRQLHEAGLVPVTLPAERVVRSRFRWESAAMNGPPPPGEGIPESADWDVAWVVLGCAARTPPPVPAAEIRDAIALRQGAAQLDHGRHPGGR
jgi:hypothetical protein